MAKNNRGGSNNSRWSGGVMDVARDRNVAAAAVAAGAAAAGLFLWSRRSQISGQLSNISDQIGQWTESMQGSGGSGSFGQSDDTAGLTSTGDTTSQSGNQTTSGRGRRSQRGMSETGGGNASLGAHTGGGGASTSASGRGRTRQSPVG